jgi:phage portal protein BeeE
MAIFQNLRQRFTSQKSSVSVPTITFTDNTEKALQLLRQSFPSTMDIAVRTAYQQNSAVYSVVRMFVSAFSEPELHVFSNNGERLKDHPLRTVLRNPMPRTSE